MNYDLVIAFLVACSLRIRGGSRLIKIDVLLRMVPSSNLGNRSGYLNILLQAPILKGRGMIQQCRLYRILQLIKSSHQPNLEAGVNWTNHRYKGIQETSGSWILLYMINPTHLGNHMLIRQMVLRSIIAP